MIASALLTLYSCNKNNDALSPEDQAALTGLRTSYTNSVTYNDSCIATLHRNDSTNFAHYDSLFHYCSGQFDDYHMQYSHGNTHDDHGHNANGSMNHHNANMNHHDGDGHHATEHDAMEMLTDSHQYDVH